MALIHFELESFFEIVETKIYPISKGYERPDSKHVVETRVRVRERVLNANQSLPSLNITALRSGLVKGCWGC